MYRFLALTVNECQLARLHSLLYTTRMEETTRSQLKAWLGSGSINIFGRPFAGKDTQGEKLAKLFDAALLGGGDILRGSEISERVKAIMRAGELIPTDDYISIVLPYLSQPSLAGQPLILSSVGRWHGEEAGVMEVTDAAGHPVKAVIYLSLNEANVRERWRRSHATNDRGARHDDTEEVLEIRLREYREKTLPVIEYYRSLGLLIEIDGSKSPDEVHSLIIDALVARAR